MPFLFPDVIRRAGIETDDDRKFALAGVDAETVAQSLLEGKLRSANERTTGGPGRLDAGGYECANIFARVVVGKEEPLAVDIGQVIRVNHPLFNRMTRLAIGELQLLPPRHRPGEGVKNLQVQDRLDP